ncbi:MAG: hypothetical protein JNM62_11465 [Flavobacteriales bacterium]|nr:hypothetical protein [Flavobacteriales bacterium]
MNILQDVLTRMGSKRIGLANWCWVVLGMALSCPLFAQVDNVMIYGTVKDLTSSKKLDGVTVTVFKNGAKLIDVPTNASGKYEVNLDYGSDYKIMVSKTGFVGKNITIDTRNVPEEERQGGHGMNIDFSMLTDLPGIDYSILNEPFGKANYAAGTFAWDIDYTNKMRDAQARLMKEYDEMRKREGDAEAKYAKLIQDGTAAMTNSDFKKAVENFSGALAAKPGDAVATAKLSDAKMRLDAQDAEKKGAEQYAALIKEADGLFGKKDYAGARTKYTAAIDLKDGEPYPKQKLKEIDAILAELEKKAEEEKKAKELQEKYQAAIAAADAAFKAESWDQATTKYSEASGLKPEEKYPKDQLALVATKKAEAAKKAEEEKKAKELEEKYKAAIAAGDAAFKTSKWDDATAKYTEASDLKPDEKYPKDQLAAILLKKDEAAKKAEEERAAKELQEKYQAAITAADAAFKGADYDAAETKYTEASGLKPAEKYPKDQLAAIAKKREELAQKADEEKRAQELNEKYQAAIAAADAAFSKDAWDEASAKYTEASGLKAAEKYPKDQLAAILAKKAAAEKAATDAAKQKELDEKYQAAITAADGAFEKEEWDLATAKYTEASGLKSTEKYPKDQLALIVTRKAEAEAKKKQGEIDAKYQTAIDAADAAFNKQDYAAARSKYTEASGVKPSEKYPKDRIGEVDALLAEAARKAEEEKKAAELEARYKALIASADKSYDSKKLSEALNDYKDASALKPAEAYPKERIAAIEQQLDATAKAKAEEERLLREQQDRDKRYGDLINAADKAFAGKQYEQARTDYSAASGVKPDEEHPKDRLAEIERLLADAARKADEDRTAAERDAAEKARKAEADRLAAEAAAAERARLEEEERRKRMAAEEIEARYRELVAAGDIAFSSDDFDKAREKYNAALEVKPDEKYPKDRLAAIDAALAARASELSEAERLAAEQKRLAEERRAKEAADAEAARLAAQSERERAEAERLRKEQEDADARRSAEERDRLARDSAKARDDQYRSAIVSADEAMAAKDYQGARGKYAEASDLKPEETYPLAKIDQIDKLLAEQERLRAEAETAAQRTAPVSEPERPVRSNMSTGQEDEAVGFMREARIREEAEKYERIKKFRSALEQEETDNAVAASERRGAGVEDRERHLEEGARLYEGNDRRRLDRADEVLALQEAVEQSEAERRERSAATRDASYKDDQAMIEAENEKASGWQGKQTERAAATENGKKELQDAEQARVEASRERTGQAREASVATGAQQGDMAKRGQAMAVGQQQLVDEEKRSVQARETSYAQNSATSRTAAQQKLNETPPDRPRAFTDHNRSKLAEEYPEGVTEESYTEGNKVIIRRVVVNGGRADEYSKVIAKWGTFYFKNGQSITEGMWRKETEG